MESAQRLLVFAPHPDDESLGTAGLIQQVLANGGQVRVVFATDGDNNPWPQRYLERRWRLDVSARQRWGARRRGEALAALQTLGVAADNAVHFLHWPDQGLAHLLADQRQPCINSLQTEILAWQPTWLAGPVSWDSHSDHAALAVMLIFALAQLDLPIRLFGYLIHGRQRGDNLIDLPLQPAQQARKVEAILCHRSQMLLSRRRFLRYARSSEVYAPALVDLQTQQLLPPHINGWLYRQAQPVAVLGSSQQNLDADPVCLPEIDFSSVSTTPAQPSSAFAHVVGVVCCYDVAAWCGAVIQELAPHVGRIVVVDDGSTDDTHQVIQAAMQAHPDRISLLTFRNNRGKGAALIAGMTCALDLHQAQVIVTVDGDGQHAGSDVPRLIQAVRQGADLAIGQRDFSCMPLRSRLGNSVSSWLMQVCYPGSPYVDTQCGLRAFSAPLARMLLAKIPAGRYETELKMLQLCLSEGWRIQSVPIQTIYLDSNRSSHFRPILDSWRILRVFFKPDPSLKHRTRLP